MSAIPLLPKKIPDGWPMYSHKNPLKRTMMNDPETMISKYARTVRDYFTILSKKRKEPESQEQEEEEEEESIGKEEPEQKKSKQ